MDPKVGCFAGFCHRCLTSMSVHMHAYCYPLFENRMKTDLWTISLCRKDIALYINTKSNSKVDYSYNGIWCTAGYGGLVIGIL